LFSSEVLYLFSLKKNEISCHTNIKKLTSSKQKNTLLYLVEEKTYSMLIKEEEEECNVTQRQRNVKIIKSSVAEF